MKIDKKKLVELLVNKTGMEATEIEDQLEQLTRRIIDAAERGKALEIKEFGLFYFDEDGDLKFDPSKELSTEINFKYAGMEPVELKPPRGFASETDQTIASSGKEPEEKDKKEDVFGRTDDKKFMPYRNEEDPDEDEDEPDDKTRAEDEEELLDIFGLGEGESYKEEDDDDNDEEMVLPWGDINMAESTEDEEGDTREPDAANSEKTSSQAVGSGKKENEIEDEAPERENDPFAGLLGDASSKLSNSEKGFTEDTDEPEHPLIKKSASGPAAEKDKKKKPEPKQPAAIPAVAAKKQEQAKTASAPRKMKPASYAAKKPGMDPVMIVIGVVLIFIIIAAGFLIIPGLFDDSGSRTVPGADTEQQMVENQQDPLSTDAGDRTMGSGTEDGELQPVEDPNRLNPPEPEIEDEVSDNVDVEPEISPESSQPLYGLRGAFDDSVNNGFSIVLHSLQQERNARSIAAELSTDGYRVLVSPRTVNGETVWRVSIGQFQTIADAQEAASTLPSPFNTNNFIQRIQTN